jgi:hypothetical protein
MGENYKIKKNFLCSDTFNTENMSRYESYATGKMFSS